MVLDPFCGCGTTIHAAQNLNRRWVGIDICVNACKVIEERLRGHFDSLWSDVKFIGMPKTRDDAQFMASSDPFRFERWAASLVDGMEANKKQTGDKGIDGWGRIPIKKGQFIDVAAQVKGGNTGPGHVRTLTRRGVRRVRTWGYSPALRQGDGGYAERSGGYRQVHGCARGADLHGRGLLPRTQTRHAGTHLVLALLILAVVTAVVLALAGCEPIAPSASESTSNDGWRRPEGVDNEQRAARR